MKADESLRPWGEIASALGSLLRPPYLVFGLLNALVTVASIGITELLGPRPAGGDLWLDVIAGIFLALASIYIQIAVILAAASNPETRAVDAWIKVALKHRCFWRYLGVTILIALLLVLGAVVFLVGAIVAGGIVALGQPSVVLERTRPVAAINRSSVLTKPARRTVALVFAIFWIAPAVWPLTAQILDIELSTAADVALGAVNAPIVIAANVAITRVFVKLGGSPAPPLQTLLYKSKAGTSG
ncbi:MAG TPA: hypothetical protein VIG64_10500 [Actinomycetota bacterium]|jgi:uncharacterized membrane protein YhaH (DUF805 family)